MDLSRPSVSYPTCPITLCEIKKGGLTVLGNLYDYNAITTWLQSHDSDPLNNIPLPSKFIIKINERILTSSTLLEQKKKDILFSTLNWSVVTRMRLKVHKKDYLSLLHKKKEIVESYPDVWNKYMNERIEEFHNHIAISGYCGIDSDSTAKKNILSVIPSLKDSALIDGFTLLNLSIKNRNITNKCYKSTCFDFADISYINFIKCDFSRTSFQNTIMEGTIFSECNFKGDTVTFYNAICSNKTVFRNCAIEPPDGSWRLCQGDIYSILLDRGIDPEVPIIVQC